MRKLERFNRGMGIGGWLTNYKRFNVLPKERRMQITVGDMEHFESYITEKDIQYIASLGMDHIRIGFDQIVLEKEPFVYREEIFSILHNFAAWCKKYSLGIVFNLHKAIGNYCDALDEDGLMKHSALQERFIALWLKIEDEFADDSWIMFELLNEVVNATADEWNNLADRTVRAIREKSPMRKIIVGCTEWNNPVGLEGLRVMDDENVIYTFHCYAPHEFTHQRGVLMPEQLFYNREMPYPGDIGRYRDYWKTVYNNEGAYPNLEKMDITYLYEYLLPVKKWIETHPDKILWCGEFGTIRHIKIEWRENWMRDMIKILKELDIPYCVWNYLSTPNDGNRFSLVDDDERKILSSELRKIINGEV